jgi:cell wall-associated NlpC family hydrolase
LYALRLFQTCIAFAVLATGGCASMASFESPPANPAAVRAAEIARGMIGTPYRWGGANPEGFDCSGLVFYAYTSTGIDVPRTSVDQFRAATGIPLRDAGPGDLVFFREAWTVSHVGIYLGEGRFVHAPDEGQAVKVSSIEEDYYRARFAGAGRILQP